MGVGYTLDNKFARTSVDARVRLYLGYNDQVRQQTRTLLMLYTAFYTADDDLLEEV